MYFESNCKKCRKDKHCCIFKNNSGFVFVGIQDARNIKRRIKKDYNYFLDYSPLPKKVIKRLKHGDPALEGKIRYSQLDKNRLLRLKTKKEGRCVFLNRFGKCSVYRVRPNICRIFPFWAIKLNNGRIKVIEHDPYPKCSVIKSKDIEEILSKKEASAIKKIFKNIEKENDYYKKNIKKFVKSRMNVYL